MRVRAMLERCELNGLANALTTDADDIREAVTKYVTENPEVQPYGVDLYLLVGASKLTYETGLANGMELVWTVLDEQSRAGACEAATSFANKVLAERAQRQGTP